MKRFLFITIFLFSAAAFGQQCVPSSRQSCTPNIQLATPFPNAPNSNVPLNQNWNWLDSLLSGNANIFPVIPTLKNVYSLDNIVYVDGQHYSGGQALQSAIQACAGSTFCVVYAMSPLIGTQTFLLNPFSGLTMPITLYTGAYTVQYDTGTLRVPFPGHFKWYSAGTTFASTAAYIQGNTVGNGGIFNNINYGTTGSMTSGSNSLTVANATGAEIGVMVLVLGANGVETKQATTINQGGGIGAGDTSFTVTSTSGWSTSSTNYLKIDSEIISATGGTGTTFSSVSRGLFGTAAATHANGATVSAIPNLISRISAVSGTTLTLEDNATSTVSGTNVVIGSTDIVLDGLTVDGKTDHVTQRFLSGIVISLGTKVTITASVKVQNMDLYGTALVGGSRYNYVSGSYENDGREAGVFGPTGADVLLFGSCSYNTVRTVAHNNGTKAIAIDDRSDSYDATNGPSNANSVILGAVINYGPTSGQPAIDIEGSNYNDVYAPYVKVLANGFATGIISAQWATNPTTLNGNTIRFGYLDASAGSGTALYSTNYTATAPPNSFIGGTISGAVSLVSGDAYRYSSTNGAFIVNGNPARTTIGSGTATSNGTAIASLTSQAQPAITITGATTGDVADCSLNVAPPATWQTGIQQILPVVTANTVTLWLSNPTAGSITPAATAFRCTVSR